MWFRKSSTGPTRQEARAYEDEARKKALQTEMALENGRLPPHVEARLRQETEGNLPWTSTLSVSEFGLLSRMGLRPIAQVMGVSYYHVNLSLNLNPLYVYDSYFMDNQEEALLEGFRLAQSRLVQEAQILGAHAVVGVTIRVEPGERAHERQFIMTGTAVAVQSIATIPSTPLLCTVSMQDFAKLLDANAVPVGLAIGVGVYYQYSTFQDMRQMMGWNNREVPVLTGSVYQVRHRAMRQLVQHASAVRPTSILAHNTHFSVEDLEVERGENDSRIDHIVQFTVIGTAVDALPHVPSHRPVTALNLGQSKWRLGEGGLGGGIE